MPCKLACFYLENSSKISLPLNSGSLNCYIFCKPTVILNFQWLRNIDEHANEDVERMILGNKCDMDDKRVVSKERGESIAREHNIYFLETSAKVWYGDLMSTKNSFHPKRFLPKIVSLCCKSVFLCIILNAY